MLRTPEPEIMAIPARARAYAAADFAFVNHAFVECVLLRCSGRSVAKLLDLGCGPGEIPLLVAERLANAQVVGLDGSAAMLQLARKRACRYDHVCRFLQADALTLPFPDDSFDVVISNSILHHVRDPVSFWRESMRIAAPDAILVHRDLCRPESPEAAQALVDEHAAGEDPLLREDFYNSLLAAYTPEEVRGQLDKIGCINCRVQQVTDRHLDVVAHRPIIVGH